jgi:hypothetical protein
VRRGRFLGGELGSSLILRGETCEEVARVECDKYDLETTTSKSSSSALTGVQVMASLARQADLWRRHL